MKQIVIFIIACLSYPAGIFAQKFKTCVFSDQVKTLRVNVTDNWRAAPVIELEGGKEIEVIFDLLEPAPGAYTYTLTHCNADWTPSQLIQSEYMSGFQDRFIEDYAVSYNTRMNYVNYRLAFPNEDVTMKISGNYVVQVFPQNSDKPILNACFSVIENRSDISMKVTSQTDKGMNNFYQQVNLVVNYGNEVKMPLQELKVYVRQNNRTDNEAALVKPLNVQNKRLVYEHIPALIFDGGNEYRSFEMTTNKYNGLNIESMKFYAPYYHAILYPDIIRSNRPYSFMDDIDGRFVVRTLSGTDYDYEADYHIVHFYLPCEKPFTENVYILSEAFNNLLDARSRMDYSDSDKGYVKSVLLKEGYYNYLYVTGKNSQSPANTTPIEGNFYQTENEYQTFVYFRPMGGRYDQLIGYQTVQIK